MILRQFLEKLEEIIDADPSYLEAHVEVHEHDDAWSWVDGASTIRLVDVEVGVTQTVIVTVSQQGVRQPPQPLGRPANPTVSHDPPLPFPKVDRTGDHA